MTDLCPGNNPTSVCELCSGHNAEHCTTSDNYAGYDGAFRCVQEGAGQLTFIRHDTIEMMLEDGVNGSSADVSYPSFLLL